MEKLLGKRAIINRDCLVFDMFMFVSYFRLDSATIRDIT